MIKPLLLGNKTFPVNIIQGPLAGVSSAPFRRLVAEYGKVAFSCTEMVSCKALKYRPKLLYQRYIAKDPKEGPVCFQLFGNDPNDLAEATKTVTDYGADLIDLNCGCPVKKVRKQLAGSVLLTDAPKLYKMILAMKQNTHLPVSIKIRVESNSKDKFNQEIANVVNDAGVDFLVVHGRHWNEHYETPVHHDQIQFFVDSVKVPVIGNGDVFCVESLKRMFRTGCAGVMIARAGVGQPWLSKKLIAEMNGEEFIPPTLKEIGNIFILHVELLAKLLNCERRAVLEARKLAKYYARGMSSKNRKEFCTAMNVCDKFNDFAVLVMAHFVEELI